MSRDEQLQGSKRATGLSPSMGSPSSTRFYGGAGVSQRQLLQRSTISAKKPPEPLRRAVADCLSSSASHLHSNPSTLSSEAARTLQDYIASPATTDLAYGVLLEHALAERDRSPAVVARCVALLKRYLLRYIPKVQTLRQIDVFCANSIAECDSATDRRVSLWSKSVKQNSVASTTGNAFAPSFAAHNFASASLVKSLNYVRSLVSRHIPKLSFQPISFSGASNAMKQSLPTLSSLLSRSFNSQLVPETVNRQESPEKEVPSSSAINLSNLENVDGGENSKYFFVDLLKWRWTGDRAQQSPSNMTESDSVVRTQDVRIHGFLEVGAAALLVVDVEAKIKGQPWKCSATTDLPDVDPVLQPSTVTTATNFISARNHIRAITSSKRMKPDQDQVWVNVPASTFHPQARPLFQYRHYSEQQPLRFNPAEVSDVIAAVCSETSSTNMNLMTTSSRLSNRSRTPSTDVAVSVLIKLVIDTYMADSGTAAPLILSMLEDMLSSPRVASRVRAFDIILNLGVHAHLLEPMLPEDLPIVGEDESSQHSYLNNDGQLVTLGRRNAESNVQHRITSAIENFESWLLFILFETLLLLVQKEEKEEIVWASALSCLFYFVCDRGKIWRNRLKGLDIRVIKALLEISREHSWAEVVHCKLICMLANMFYQVADDPTNSFSNCQEFLVGQVELLGGIEFICLEYSRANTREEKRNLFLVLFDYILHQINESCLATGGSTYTFDEVQPLAAMLTLADAPEAFYITIKYGVEGMGEILRRFISAALSTTSNFERLNLLLEKITRKLDATICSFTGIDNEFSYMIRITKSYKTLKSIEDGLMVADIGMKVKLSWATLHSLLHSDRPAYRHNGYIWLVELLLSEVNEEGDVSIWFNIKKLRQQIGIAGSQDSTSSSVPLPISLMCGLLKSKHSNIRWGFLFVLEKLLLHCKLLLEENELQHLSNEKFVSYDHADSRLEKANAVIDIMSCALTLVVQINETDCINILKMCDMLFSQLCLRFLPAKGMALGNLRGLGNLFGCTNESSKDVDLCVPQHEKNGCRDVFLENIGIRTGLKEPPLNCETASMAALLLRGYAVVPMQLVAHVPTSLFYWPLIQLAGAATDDIALGVAVGSKGRGNLPGATSDIRAALLLLLIGKCTADPAAFVEVGEEDFFRELLDDTDSRVAYYSSAFLLKRMMTEQPENYQRMLQSLIFKAQQSNNEKLLENPYLQMHGILQLSSDLGTQL